MRKSGRKQRRREKSKVDARVFQSDPPSGSGWSAGANGDDLEPRVAVTVAGSEIPRSSGDASPPSRPSIAGRYRLDERLAEGGMGIVYSGWHVTLDQPVAVKVIRRELVNNADAVQRFIEEARALAQLRGAHVAQVLDAGIEDGSPFIVMELLRGKDLRTLLEQTREIAPGYAVRLVREACEAVAEAHAKGIVHRDIKPENLFLSEGDDGTHTLKVIDFGISARQGADGNYDSQSLGPGSPEYMSPEQLLPGHVVDHRADIWSLGVVLFELLTGSVPFTGETQHEICSRVVTGDPPPVTGRAQEVPDALTPLILKCLSKSADQRFSSALELASALRPFEAQLGSEPPAALEPRPATEPPPGPDPYRPSLPTAEYVVPAARGATQSPRLLLGVVAGIVMGVGVYFVAGSTSSGGADTAQPAGSQQQGVVGGPQVGSESGPEVVPVTEGPSVTPFLGEEERSALEDTPMPVAPRWRAAPRPRPVASAELDAQLDAIEEDTAPIVSAAPPSEEQVVEARYALAAKKPASPAAAQEEQEEPGTQNPYESKAKAKPPAKPSTPAEPVPADGSKVPSTAAFPEVSR